MPELPIARPDVLGFDSARLERAFEAARRWTSDGKVPAIGLCVGRRGKIIEPFLAGVQSPSGNAALKRDALFLVASLTKPVTVAAVMLLVERGQVALDDRVATFVPRFAANGKNEVRVRHLMTHTSGLPDMLPNNIELREKHKPLKDFIDAICELPLAFEPGTKVSYQSTGTAMLGEIVHQVSGSALPEFLKKEIFDPLGMADTSLGWNASKKERISAIRLPDDQRGKDWSWNSPYWLGFAGPWGGLVTSPADYARFCHVMLHGGMLDNVPIFSPATVRAMTTNQLAAMPQIPEEDRRGKPWGLGWRLNWPGVSESFSDFLGPRAFGHWGATGTLCWLDPNAEAFGVLFTTLPLDLGGNLYLVRLTNMILAAIEK